MAPVIGYFRNISAAEPRANNIVSVSYTWGGSSSFNGRVMEYSNGSSTTTVNFQYSGTYSAGWYYSKGVSYTDLVHFHGVVPAGEAWPIRIWSSCTNFVDTDEFLGGGIYIWRGATDSLAEVIGTFRQPVTTTQTAYTISSITNASDVVLYRGDRIAVEFWGEIHILGGPVAITKAGISVHVNSSTRDSYLTYPNILEMRNYSEGHLERGLL